MESREELTQRKYNQALGVVRRDMRTRGSFVVNVTVMTVREMWKARILTLLMKKQRLCKMKQVSNIFVILVKSWGIHHKY